MGRKRYEARNSVNQWKERNAKKKARLAKKHLAAKADASTASK
jgi:hypothetical protein